MNALEIAAKHTNRAQDELAKRKALVREHAPDLVAFVADLAKAGLSPRIVHIDAPWLQYTAPGCEPKDGVPADVWLENSKAAREANGKR